MNEHDSARVAGLLESHGLEPAGEVPSADVLFVNTCCIRENADNKLYGYLGQLKSLREANPAMRIVVGGCLAQREGAAVLERAPFVDVVVGTHNLGAIPGLLEQRERDGLPAVEILGGVSASKRVSLRVAPREIGEPVWNLPPATEQRFSAFVSIQQGCNNSCTFCTVPMVRGGEVSRPMESIVEEVEALAVTGVTEVTLLGQNVNSYGRDITGRSPLFAELLARVGSVEGVRRIRFTSPHPKDLRPETVEAMAEVESVCEQLHLPLQSGSDTVLARMHRGYTAARYLEKLASARAVIPDLGVTTDLIVGFPGETEDEFACTLEVVAEAFYDSAYTFNFSPRPGTPAAGMAGEFVDPAVVRDRFTRLLAVVERAALQHNESRIGMIEEVLVERVADAPAAVGRTRQGKLVHFAVSAAGRVGSSSLSGDAEESSADNLSGGVAAVSAGDYITVRITGAGPHHLKGMLAGA